MTNKIRIFLLIIAVVPAFCILPGASPIPRNVKMPFKNSYFRPIDSAMIHYRLWVTKVKPAKGKVLFIHGFTGSTFSFRKNYDSLMNAGYNIAAIDLPAFGYSDKGTWINHSQSSRAVLVWKLLDRIDNGDTSAWNIIGHDMGGGTAEAVALLRPSRTKSLVLIDAMFFNNNLVITCTGSSFSNIKPVKKFYADYVKHRLVTFDHMQKLLRSGYGRLPDTADVTGYMMPLRIPETVDAIVSTFSNCREVVTLNSDSLKQIPVLVVWGSKDSWIPPGNAEVIKQYVPQMELHSINGAGHMPMETHPAQFNAILLQFLNKVNAK